MIALLVLFAALALGTGAAFVGRAARTGAGPRLPLPDQIAAIVELLDCLPLDGRSQVLRAANSDLLAVSVADNLPKEPREGKRMPGVEWFMDQYFSSPGKPPFTPGTKLPQAGSTIAERRRSGPCAPPCLWLSA